MLSIECKSSQSPGERNQQRKARGQQPESRPADQTKQQKGNAYELKAGTDILGRI